MALSPLASANKASEIAVIGVGPGAVSRTPSFTVMY
uniref:Uncharacterized protein n=1 Tax=Anguilla anguilla TaxID=7936 RepID=A0A0E9UE56_ANGAN